MADNKAQIESRVRSIISKKMGIREEEILPESKFSTDLGMDSLDGVELLMTTEVEFNISIPDEEWEELASVQQVVDYLESKGV